MAQMQIQMIPGLERRFAGAAMLLALTVALTACTGASSSPGAEATSLSALALIASLGLGLLVLPRLRRPWAPRAAALGLLSALTVGALCLAWPRGSPLPPPAGLYSLVMAHAFRQRASTATPSQDGLARP